MGDSNWFYSTLSQSAAAIVGLIGALFLSKILEEARILREVRSNLHHKTANLIKRSESVIEKISLIEKGINHILDDVDVNNAKSVSYGLPSPYKTNISVEKGDNDERIKEELRGLSVYLNEIKRSLRGIKINKFPAGFRSTKEAREFSKKVSKQFDDEFNRNLLKELDKINTELGDLFQDSVSFGLRRIPRTYYILLFLLAFISYFGVIEPLKHLSGYSIELVIYFGVGLFVVIILFAYMIFDIRRA